MTAAHERGARAEDAVVDFLTTLGFEILGRNVRLGRLEIDVIARKGVLATMVEVRTRGGGSYVGPLESIGARKRATMLRAAERLWREKLSKLDGVERLRLDVAAVTFEGTRARVEYVEGALTA